MVEPSEPSESEATDEPVDERADGTAGADTEKSAGKRKSRWRFAAEIGVVILLFIGFRTWQQRNVADGPAPALQGMSIQGTPFALAHDGERPTLVHFWATWCGVCETEHGTIEGLAEDEYRVVTVATQSGGSAEVEAYMRSHDLDFPVLADPSATLAHRWGVSAFPTSFVVSPDGGIRHVEVGYTTSFGFRARMWLASLM